jgi:hypothetical protein
VAQLNTSPSRWRFVGTAAAAALLAAAFIANSIANSRHEDYRESNYAKFWIAGHMILTGQSPYNPAQWEAEHLRLGSARNPDPIFLYPLPQAFLLTPLALVPPASSFVLWGIISQAVIAASCYALLRRSGSVEPKRLAVPLSLILLFFGPVYLSLQIGSIGAIALAACVGCILLLDRKQPFLAGVVLSVLTLKPPQGFPILLLAALWFLLRKDARPILGMLAGALVLLLCGLLYDPHWIATFLATSQVVSGRTIGTQSNIWSFSYLLCRQDGICTAVAGSIGLIAFLALGAWMIWRHRARAEAWTAFSLIIPISFMCAVYLFAYDQMLYVIPITWICSKLIERTRSYLPSFMYLMILDVVSIVLLLVQATTQRDIWNILTTVLVLVPCIWLLEMDRFRPLPSSLPA